ncbi:PREDICTED: vitellogenin-2-like [Gekko japonicus]|uniref:Vitellogenin-2-like n=1 Tax=Gekko japonicus TaxID=146911 RepID=A0ABM1KME2_GEKJA|nr:PREDICTED: vitellogenin-2-like [Gekko japonicus]
MGYGDLDTPRPKIEVVVSNTSEPNKPQAFMEAGFLNPHKAVAVVKFGRNCNQYEIKATAETGLFDYHPALQMKVDYARVPSYIKKFGNDFSSMILEMLFMLHSSQEERRNPSGQVKIITVASASPKYDVILKTPHAITTVPNVLLPWSLSEDEFNPAKRQLSLLELITNPTHKGVCKVYHNNLITFDGAEIQILQVPNCPLILAKYRYEGKQFSVMMMQRSINDLSTDLIFENNGREIRLTIRDGRYQIEFDHVAVPLSSFPLHLRHDADITIKEENGQLVLEAAKQLTCYYDGQNITIEANPKMQGELQGLCGRFDGEQEFRTPSGYTAKNAWSFVQSWVHTEGPCDEDCNLKHSHVKLENTIEYLGEQSECFTVQPVLQCRAGCLATATTSIPIAMHCLPAGSTTNLLDTQMRLEQKSEDLEHLVEVHRSCSCENKRCAS